MVIPGLPEGLEVVGWQKPKNEDYILSNGYLGKVGPGFPSDGALVVKAASGWLIHYRGISNSYEVERTLAEPREYEASFRFESATDEAYALNVLPKLRGFIAAELASPEPSMAVAMANLIEPGFDATAGRFVKDA